MLRTGAGQTCLASARNLFVCNRKLLRVSQIVPRTEENAVDESIEKPSNESGEFDLGEILGERRAFGAVAGRCSAAEAACLRRIRNEKLYKSRSEHWNAFCIEYLGMSKRNADRIIRYLDEFGTVYFEIAQLTRISPETFRAIAPAVEDHQLRTGGETIALIPENARKVAAAVDELRRAAAARPPAERPLRDRITTLERRARELTEEFSDLSHSVPRTGEHLTFLAILGHMKSTLARLEMEAKV
jgi:hypothetical protein